MKHLYLILLPILFLQCQKEMPEPNPKDASRIEGRWESLLPSNPEWAYSFEDGFLTQTHTNFGTVLSSQTYTYATRNDTVFIGGSGLNMERRWKVYFHCDSIVEARTATPGSVLAPTIWLKRSL
ncbi:MAG: hypothetical protein JNM22_05605 [Saprospiraceae bacterium]|nr:hypothetical protein [Saprospiraceae bacterium]